MKDYYAILGLDPAASADEIKKAFKKLAMQHHPDRGGDAAKFAEINEAYAVLSDPDSKLRYDTMGSGTGHSASHFTFDNFFDLFQQHTPRSQRPVAYRLQLWITLRDVAQAGTRLVAVATSRGTARVEIQLPDGIQDGDSVRYPRLGPDGNDIVVTFRVQPDAQWHRQGDDVTTEAVVPLWQLILGTSITVECLDGAKISVAVPARTQPGTLMRLKSKGLRVKNHSARGDLYVKIQTRLPDDIPQNLIEQIRQLAL